MSRSEIEKLALLPDAEIDQILTSLGEQGQYQILHDWAWNARPEQLAPNLLSVHKNWRIWLIMAGRGFGKTRAGAEWVRAIAENDPTARIALIGANHHEARSIMVTGESGLLSIGSEDDRPIYESSLRRLTYPNGAQAFCYSAGEAEALRGPQHSHAWCDELAKWNIGDDHNGDIWDNLWMGMRLGDHPQCIVTTTPRPVPMLKRVMAEKNIVITTGSTHENSGNLPAQFIDTVNSQYGGTLLGRQELDGELIEDIEGALWSRSLIEAHRIDAISVDDLRRVIIAVDPPISAHGDACGIIAAGLDSDGKAYVLGDHSIEKASPETWARKVADATGIWAADRIVAEANQGGAMVKSVLRAAGIAAPVTLVHASRGKVARAEPVAALYETGRVSHVGMFAHLEDQLCGLMTGGEYIGPGRSPDRADALVWALSSLLLTTHNRPKIRR